MMFRLISALFVAFALTLAGCGGGDENGHAGPGHDAAGGDEAPTIAVSIPAATHGWPAGVIWWAEQTMAEYPQVEWEFVTAGSAAEQADQIETLLQKGLDGLVVLPFDSDSPLPAIKKAKQFGVFVVSVDRGLREPVADIYLAGDNVAFGRESAKWMVDRLEGTGKIVILRGMQVEIDEERYDGAMGVFQQYPEIQVLGAEHGDWNREKAYNVMQTFLTKHPQIDAVWASDDDMALGVEQAIREAGRSEEMWIFGGAGMKEIVKKVMDEDPMYPADITYPPGMISAGIHLAVGQVTEGDPKATLDAIPDYLGVTEESFGETTGDQQKVTVPVRLITPGNAKEFYFPESAY